MWVHVTKVRTNLSIVKIQEKISAQEYISNHQSSHSLNGKKANLSYSITYKNLIALIEREVLVSQLTILATLGFNLISHHHHLLQQP